MKMNKYCCLLCSVGIFSALRVENDGYTYTDKVEGDCLVDATEWLEVGTGNIANKREE